MVLTLILCAIAVVAPGLFEKKDAGQDGEDAGQTTQTDGTDEKADVKSQASSVGKEEPQSAQPSEKQTDAQTLDARSQNEEGSQPQSASGSSTSSRSSYRSEKGDKGEEVVEQKSPSVLHKTIPGMVTGATAVLVSIVFFLDVGVLCTTRHVVKKSSGGVASLHIGPAVRTFHVLCLMFADSEFGSSGSSLAR